MFKPLVINDEQFEIKKGTPFILIYVTNIYKQILLYVFFVQNRSSYICFFFKPSNTLILTEIHNEFRFIAFFHSRFNSDEVIVVDCKGDCKLNVILLFHNSIDSPDFNILNRKIQIISKHNFQTIKMEYQIW